MLKRSWCLLLVIALLATPGAAFAATPDRATPDRGPTLVERVWGGLVRLLDLDLDRDDRGDGIREPEGPRSVSANDDGGGHTDPDG